MNILRTTAIMAIVMYAGYWLDSAHHRHKRREKAEREAIHDWEGEGGNVAD